MLTLLMTFLKLQAGFTAVFALSFSMAMRNFEVEGAELQELQLEVEKLEDQELKKAPAEEVKPAEEEKKEE